MDGDISVVLVVVDFLVVGFFVDFIVVGLAFIVDVFIVVVVDVVGIAVVVSPDGSQVQNLASQFPAAQFRAHHSSMAALPNQTFTAKHRPFTLLVAKLDLTVEDTENGAIVEVPVFVSLEFEMIGDGSDCPCSAFLTAFIKGNFPCPQ